MRNLLLNIINAIREIFWLGEDYKNILINQRDSYSLNKDEVFPFSGESRVLEKYKCFDDNASLDWQDGEELLHNSQWNDEQIKLWRYFYRPYGIYNVAKKQRELIADKTASIIERLQWLKVLKLSILLMTVIVSTSVFFDISYLLFVCGMIVLFFLIYTHYNVEVEFKRLCDEVENLEYEVNCLLKIRERILNNVISSSDVEKIFWRHMRELEEYFIESFLGKNVSSFKASARNYYNGNMISGFFKNNNIISPIFPLIPSWALLQEAQWKEDEILKKTGLYTLGGEIGDKVATWRKSDEGKVFFRAYYIQFLFFQEKSISIISVYYDFITKKKYGIRRGVYPYSHISHCSYDDESLAYMIENPMFKEVNIPQELTSNIYGNETKVISLSFSSGLSYKCVLPDEDVSDGLNRWLLHKKEHYDKAKDAGSLSDENKRKMLFDDIRYDELVLTLAHESFKEINKRIEEFSIKESSMGG